MGKIKKHGLALFLLLGILFPSFIITTVFGSGEVTVKPLFEIIRYSILPKEVGRGEKVSALVTIKSNDDTKRTFYVGFAVQDPNGNWQIIPYETIILDSKATDTVILEWMVDSSAPFGYYNAKVTVWTYEPHNVETQEKFNAFKVYQLELTSFYDKYSEAIKKAYTYGTSYLIPVTKEELEKDLKELYLPSILDISTTFALTIIKETKVLEEIEELYELLSTPEKIEKMVKIAQTENLREAIGVLFFGTALKKLERVIIADSIAKDMTSIYGYVNFVVVKVPQAIYDPQYYRFLDGYDIFIVSFGFHYTVKENGMIITSDTIFPFYVGRYTIHQLPQIIYEKLKP